MAIVAGFDLHRRQITFDSLDTETGEVKRGRIDSSPAAVRLWTERLAARQVHVAVEACTGWLFVCDALVAAGATPHLAEPAETRALRGRKRRAKTDREDARWLRELLAEGRLPEAWIPPEHVRQWRSRARLRHSLIDERVAAAHPGDPVSSRCGRHAGAVAQRRGAGLLAAPGVAGRCARADRDRARDGRCDRGAVGSARAGAAPVGAPSNRLPSADGPLRDGRADLAGHLCELGDVQRLSASRKAVRMAGIDIGVHRSDRRSRAGKLTRQGSPQLRWALYEAALAACRPSSPDHANYQALKARGLSHTRASLTIARKLARRSYHVLRELGPAALEPVAAD